MVVFAPHQDDETLGCGGAIRQKIEAGQEIYIVYMADGSTSHSSFLPFSELAEIRKREAVEACEVLGVSQDRILFLGFQDGNLSRDQQPAIDHVKNILQKYRPDEVFIPFKFDATTDHIATNKIVYKAINNIKHCCVVFEYPIWFWFHWPWISIKKLERHYYKIWITNSIKTVFGVTTPRHFNMALEITDVLETKKLALSKHISQMVRPEDQMDWPVLGEIAQGDFLDLFLGNREYYFRKELMFSEGDISS